MVLCNNVESNIVAQRVLSKSRRRKEIVLSRNPTISWYINNTVAMCVHICLARIDAPKTLAATEHVIQSSN
jgi:hypothetical protein